MSSFNSAPVADAGPKSPQSCGPSTGRLTLVTGATGLVGNNVVRMLLARGERVRVLLRPDSDDRPLAGLDVERSAGDVRDADSVRRAAVGVDRVVHSAGYVHIGWRKPELYESINVTGTRHVVDAARAVDARMVHVSTVDTLGSGAVEAPADEDTPPAPLRIPYVVSKRAAERIVQDGVSRGLDAVIVNPVLMFGPWDWKPSSGRLLLSGGRWGYLMVPRGGNDICDVRDVADGIWSALERGRGGARYILGGEPLSYLEVFRLFSEVTGRLRPWCRLGPLMVMIGGWGGDQLARVLKNEPNVNSAASRMSSMRHHFSYARAARELGYSPRPARQAIADAWEWFCSNGYVRWRKPR